MKQTKTWRLLAAFLTLFGSGFSQASSLSATENARFIEETLSDSIDLPVVLTPSRMATPIHESPTAVTVIDRELIQASGATSVFELLRLVPGIMASFEESWKPSIRYHGPSTSGSARHLQVLIDGRSVYQPGYAEVYWDWINIEPVDIERIEVVRGPSTTTHGANAFSGTIQIITRHALDDSGTRTGVELDSDGKRKLWLRQNLQQASSAWRLGLGWESKDGFAYKLDDDRTLDNPDRSILRNINLRGDIQIDPQQELLLDFGILAGQVGVGYADGHSEYDFIPAHNMEVQTQHAQARWTYQQSDRQQWMLQGYVQEMSQKNRWNGCREIGPLTLCSPLDEDRTERQFELEAQAITEWNPNLRSVSGGTWRWDAARGDTWFENDDWVKNQRQSVFTNLEIRPLDTTVLHLGLSGEHSDHLSATEWNHHAALTHSFEPSTSLRLGLSKATRFPDLFESQGVWAYRINGTGTQAGITAPVTGNYALGTASPNLKPETIKAYEIGLRGNDWLGSLDFDLRLFSEQSRDLVDETRTNTIPVNDAINPGDSIKTVINEDWLDAQGIETEINWQLTKKLRLRGNYSHLTSLDSNDPELIESIPRDIGSLLAIQKLGKSSNLTLGFHYLGSFDGFRNLPEHPHRIYALNYSTNHKIGNQKITWIAGWQHHDADSIPMVGNNRRDDRNIFSLRLNSSF